MAAYKIPCKYTHTRNSNVNRGVDGIDLSNSCFPAQEVGHVSGADDGVAFQMQLVSSSGLPLKFPAAT